MYTSVGIQAPLVKIPGKTLWSYGFFRFTEYQNRIQNRGLAGVRRIPSKV